MRSFWPRERRSSEPCPSTESLDRGTPKARPAADNLSVPMRLVRLAAASLAALALATPAGGALRGPVPLAPLQRPDGLKGFLLRSSDPPTHTFSRTPSFAWSPVPGALRYEFEVATSKRFTENAVLWSDASLKSRKRCLPRYDESAVHIVGTPAKN